MHSDCIDWAAERHRGQQTCRASICRIIVCESIAHGVLPFARMHDRLRHDPVNQCFVSAFAAFHFFSGSLLHGLQAGFVQAKQCQSTHISAVVGYNSHILGILLAPA